MDQLVECDRLARLYTPVEKAVVELHERRRAVTTQTCDALEKKLLSRAHAILFRQVATPNFELERFVALSISSGLSPLVLEFRRDKFVSVNPMKYALARMCFHEGNDRNGNSRVRNISVADMLAADGTMLQDAVTHWRQNLIAFHHELLSMQPSLSNVETYDVSAWLGAYGPSAQQYYPEFFTLFIDRAILFESFLVTPREARFTDEIIIPAFDAARARRGLRPLICRLDPPETEGDPYWLQYPQELEAFVGAKLATTLKNA